MPNDPKESLGPRAAASIEWLMHVGQREMSHEEAHSLPTLRTLPTAADPRPPSPRRRGSQRL